ncbi:cysteine dioxygenase family protein [Saccharopolyspora sp. HNM0983]|uniref:Cysteine dioxygenase family protein n=1 Tax=Saccharopolyspora montiporae TaxID=2781240 RepID=A0A929B8T2_9PSEU|nr:cysteine dioxygenase family protein [Saccharopolyspora sp. HNM0983]MBE9373663.1 cysteine dioxygenase family protein [Saccharopolyspora sp. HNM0983]
MSAPAHISQYTPVDEVPELGGAEIHPGIDSPLLRDVIHPDRAQWTPRELRELTHVAITELTGPLLDVVQIRDDHRWWARLALTAGVELWLLSWSPGQGTEPHDHGGASGSFAVLFGALREDYRYSTGPVRTREHELGAAIGFGPGRAHRVHNASSVNAASVHAYSSPLLPVRHYARLTDVPPRPVAAEREVLG